MENPSNKMDKDKAIILFDGVCNLCNGFVQFVIRRDRKNQFLFTSQQSEAGQALLRQYELPTEQFSTFVYIDYRGHYIRSSGALFVFERLGGKWKALSYIGRILPKGLRDSLYRVVAHNRYKWFGKKEECMIPTPDLKKRFLETEQDLVTQMSS